MLCRSEVEIPPGPGLVYEPKWDGFRCIVFREGDSIHLESRNSLPLQRYFPELLDPLRAALPELAVVDGEIVIAGPRGLDFDALQLRLHPAESRVRMLAAESPATFIAFDLLAVGEEDLRGQALQQRARRLGAVLIPNSRVALTPQTTDPEEAANWFERYEGAGCDGVVAKPLELDIPERGSRLDQGQASPHRRLRGRRLPQGPQGRGGGVAPARPVRR